MEREGHFEIRRSQMLAIEIVSIIAMFLLLTQEIVSNIIDAAIVVIASSVVGYVTLYIYDRSTKPD